MLNPHRLIRPLPPADPLWANVTALVRMNGCGTNEYFVDDADGVADWPPVSVTCRASVWRKENSPTAYFHEGLTGVLVGGAQTSNRRLTGAGSTFCIEAWVKPTQINSTGAGAPIFSNTVDIGSVAQFFGINSAGNLELYRPSFMTGGPLSVTGATAVALNVWQHIAVTYDGTTVRLFLDGVLDGSGADATGWTWVVGEQCYIGHTRHPNSPTADRSFEGYMDDFRITDLNKRYADAGFTPPDDMANF